MLCLFASSAFCQKKAFKTALSKPRALGKGYRMNYPREYNTKEMAIWKMRDYDKYITKHEFIVISKKYNYKNYIDEYDYVDFVPKTEYTQYIMENLNNCKPLDNLVNQGSVYFYKSDTTNPFILVENVRWSGQIKDGKIQGDGFGIAMLNDHEYYRVKGKFENGVLQGAGEFAYYQESDYGGYNNGKLKINKIEVGAYADGLAWIKIKDKYGYISSDHKIAIPTRYDGAHDFANGIAIVKIGNTETKINKKGETLGLADNTQFTYKQAVEMKKTQPHLAKQMEDWVSNFIDQSKTYNELIGIEKDFPMLANKADKRKKEIYQIDCKHLKTLLEEAKQKSSGNEFAKAGKKEYAEYFVSTYTKNNYDPANMMPLANELTRYYKVWKKIEDYERINFVVYDESLSEAIKSLGEYNSKPILHRDWALKEETEIKKAQEICQDPGKFGLDNFYKKAYDRLAVRYTNFKKNFEKSSDEYHKEMGKRNARKAKLREQDERELAETREQEKVKIPKYELSGWKKKSFLDADLLDEYTEVIFEDFISGYVSRNSDNEFKADSSGKHYKSLYDAIAAEYMYIKFQVIRKIGLIK